MGQEDGSFMTEKQVPGFLVILSLLWYLGLLKPGITQKGKMSGQDLGR